MEIIIPAYNCTKTLGVALDSLVAQTNKNFTVLIVDDCSSQDIYSIIEQYSDKLNIRYVRNEQNVGCGMTRQRGMDETTADYIAFLDSDDRLLPEAIDIWTREIQVNRPDVIYSPHMRMRGDKLSHHTPTPLHMCHGKVYNVEFMRRYDIQESEDIKCNDDLYLNLQAFSLAQKVSILDTPTCLWVYTEGSITTQKGFAWRATAERKLTFDLAASRVSRFKSNLLEQYKELDRKIYCDIMLPKENN